MKISHQRSITRGFIILEALISLIIVSSGILAMTKLQATVSSSVTDSRIRSIAMQLAEQQIEDLRRDATLPDFSTRVCAAGTATTVTRNVSTINSITIPTVFTIETSRPVCTNSTAIITVRVSWTGAVPNAENNLITVSTNLRFIDPSVSSALAQPPGDSGGIGLPGGNARRINENWTSTPPAEISTATFAADGTLRIRPPGGSEEILWIRRQGTNGQPEFRRVMASNDDIVVAASGLVVKDTTIADNDSSFRWNNFRMFTTGVGFCTFPLDVSGGINSPTTYTGPVLSPINTVRAYGYRCFVPQGWYGTIDLDFSTNLPNNSNFTGCPADDSGSRAASRSHKVVIQNAGETQQLGQSGLTFFHEANNLLLRLDFLIFNRDNSGNANAISSCQRLFSNLAGSIANRSDATIRNLFINSAGLDGNALTAACRTSVFCLKPFDYWVETVTIGSITISGRLTFNPSSIGDAFAAPIQLVDSNGDTVSTCSISTSNDVTAYSCTVSTGSTGFSGTINSDGSVNLCGNTSFTNASSNIHGRDLIVQTTPCS